MNQNIIYALDIFKQGMLGIFVVLGLIALVVYWMGRPGGRGK